MRKNSAIIFRNYGSSECSDICRKSSGCIAYVYGADMYLYSKKDEENGCHLYYYPSNGQVPSRDPTLVVNPGRELACEKTTGGKIL